MVDMKITDNEVLADLDTLAEATGRTPNDLILEIVRNFFRPRYKHELINEFRWRMDIIGGIDLEPLPRESTHALASSKV
ncbi:hypothetical protein [Luteibacter aegosomatissinici]|uniref:hypothetical protein n=1 Tax=Luteibacter aegosomatissinici TaxID=2911539 RepID=UPI001FF8E77E|nr:hypothetical protein [Luteibacter aegosomatissinici]UPG94516.1 hypothetical protein L2Y97_22305 [Luteibacter aegosomatissinici]